MNRKARSDILDPLRKGIAIGMLFGSEGRTATNLIESKTIRANDTYSAIYEIDPETGEIYDPPKDGYETVVVSLPIYNKRVALTTSDVTGSQTAIFEYDPQDETPTPWEGYLYFTIDLSGVKRDINDLLDQISALEDELEDCHDCRDEVVAALQRYDPSYDPAEGECPSDKVDEVVAEVENLQDEVEACHDCKDAVVAAIQQYVPSFTPDPTTCNIPDGVDDVYDQGREDEATENPPGYTFPDDMPITDISKIVAYDLIGSENSDYYLKVYVHAYQWGVTPPQMYDGRTVYATSETGELSAQMCADVVDGSGAIIRHYISSSGYSVFPQLNGYAQISDYSITNDAITINMFIYRNDGWSSTKTATFSDLLFADFATGPYTVKNS